MKKSKRQADFIKCIAWNKKADAITKYFDKGYRIALGGHLRQDELVNEQTQEKFEFIQCVVDDFNYIERKLDKEVSLTPEEQHTIDNGDVKYYTDESGLNWPVNDGMTPEEQKALKEFRESIESKSEPAAEQQHNNTDAVEEETEIAGPDEEI